MWWYDKRRYFYIIDVCIIVDNLELNIFINMTFDTEYLYRHIDIFQYFDVLKVNYVQLVNLESDFECVLFYILEWSTM